MAKADTVAEILLMKHLKEAGLSFVRECRFHPTRKWRFDFADPERMIAIEIEGGIWSNGRHTRGVGFERDVRKYNEALNLGWALIRFTPGMIARGESKVFIDRFLKGPSFCRTSTSAKK